MDFFAQDPDKLPDGLYGSEVSVRFFGPDLQGADAFLELLGARAQRFGKLGTQFDIGILTDAPPPFGLLCNISGFFGPKGKRLTLRLRRKPEGDPPPGPLKDTTTFGTYPEGFIKLIAPFAGTSVECNTRFDGAIFNPRRWAPNFKWSSTPDVSPLRLTSDEKQFDHENGGHVRISRPPHKGFLMFESFAKTTVALAPDCFDVTCQSLWKQITPLFKRHGKAKLE